MASTYTFNSSGTAAYGGRYFRVTCKQKQDISKNTSTITWTLETLGGSVLYYSTGPTELKIGGKQVYYCARTEWETGAFPAAKGSVSGTITLSHNDDGSKKASVYLTSAVYVGSASQTQCGGIWTLDTIPRKATITSAPNFTDNDNPTMKYSNLAGSAISELGAYIAMVDDNGKESNVRTDYRYPSITGSSISFDLSEDERDRFRNYTKGSSRKALFVLRTQLGGSTYWHTVEKTFTVQETDATKPSVDMTISPLNDGVDEKFAGVFIQGKSRATVTLTASGKYNADIKSYATEIGGKTYTEAEFTSDVLNASGDKTIIGQAVDSRGFTGSASQEITVHEYVTPSISIMGDTPESSCYRSDDNGNPKSNSDEVWIKVKRICSSVGELNTCNLTYTVIPGNGNTPIRGTLLSSTDKVDEYNRLISGVEFDPKESYAVRVEVTDDIGESATFTFYIPTEDVPLHLGYEGKNTAIGGYADYTKPHTFQVYWKSYLYEGATIGNENGVGDVLAFAEGCEDGVTPFTTHGESTNIPSDSFKYCSGMVYKRTAEQITVQILGYQGGVTAINTYNGSYGWTGWRYDDPIVESHINTNETGWSYEVYASGKAHCWGNFDMSITIDTQWEDIWYIGKGVSIDYPFTFAEIPTCTFNRVHYRFMLLDGVGGEGNESKTPQPALARCNLTGAARTYRYCFDAWGIKA